MIVEDVEGIEFADPEIQKPHSENRRVRHLLTKDGTCSFLLSANHAQSVQ
jgi:hypothetical protein